MKSAQVRDLVISKVKANKKTSRVYDGFEKDMEYYFHVIERINMMPRNAANIDGIPFDKIPIIDAFSDLIMPNSLTVSGEETQKDFLVRDYSAEGVAIDVDRITDIISAFYSMFKADVKERNVSDCRVDLTMSNKEVADSLSFEGRCVSDQPSRYPIPVSVAMYRDTKYLFDEDEVIREYLDKKFKDLRK